MGIIDKFFSVLTNPKTATWSAGVAFNRSNPLPLDKWSVFNSMDDAVAYAESNPVAYPGQVIAVRNGLKMVAYVLSEQALDEENSKLFLDPIGIIPTGSGAIEVTPEGVISIGVDDATIKVVDGALTLNGYKDAPLGALLVKDMDGTLKWVTPSNETVEGLQTTVGTLQLNVETINSNISDLTNSLQELETNIGEDISDIQDAIGVPANAELNQEASGLYAALDLKANKADVYTKTQVNDAIASAVSAAEHLKRVIVDDVSDINKYAEDALHYIYMVPTGFVEEEDKYDEYIVIELTNVDEVTGEETIIREVEKVGSWEVNLEDYAKKSEVEDLASDVKILSGQLSTINTTLAGEIAANKGLIEDNAADIILLDTNKADKATTLEGYGITDAYTTTLVDDKITLAVNVVATSLSDYKEENVSKFEEIDSSLEKLKDAEANYISSVSTDFLVIDGNLILKDLPLTKVIGLQDISNNVNLLVTNVGTLTSTVETLTTDVESVAADTKELQTNVGILQTNVGSLTGRVEVLEKSLNGYTDESGLQVVGVVAELQTVKSDLQAVKTNYVTTDTLNATIDNLSDLIADKTDYAARIEDIEKILLWGEINSI